MLGSSYILSTMATTKSKRKRNGAGRRQKTLLKKAYELGTFPGIEVAVIIFKRGRYSMYRSTDRESWPPPMAEIVSEAGSNLKYLANTNAANCVSYP